MHRITHRRSAMNASDKLDSVKPSPSFYHFTYRDWPELENDEVPPVPVPSLEELELLCAGLPDDCRAGGLPANKVCNRYSCKICAPARFRAGLESAFATAANHGLRYRLTVLPEAGIQPSEHGQALKLSHGHLTHNAKDGAGHPHSYICSFSGTCSGVMCLEYLTNADFRRSLVSKQNMPLDLKMLGKTYRKLRASGLVTFREIGQGNARNEILSMVKAVITLQSTGVLPPWAISSSFDIGITVRKALKPRDTAKADAA